MGRQYYVYILANRRNVTLYTGMTNNLVRRVAEHKESAVSGFTQTHGIKTLVYFEVFEDASNAIAREKAVKRWRRQWKINAIEKMNPEWRDLYEELL